MAILLVVDVFSGIMARFINFNIVFSEELGKYLFIWLSMLGISVAAKDKLHIRIDYFTSKIPVNQNLLYVFSLVFFLIFSVFFAYLGSKLTIYHLIIGKSTCGFRFPMFIFTAALPIGFGLTSLNIIIQIKEEIVKILLKRNSKQNSSIG
ncbi:MAG: TRAP transporter small permease [Candidatus Asgardarchaeum sp.]